MEMQNKVDIPLVVVAGSPRSGTNLLQGFLDANPETIAPVEFPFILLYEPLFRRKSNWNKADADLFIEWIQKDIKYKFWSLSRWHIDIEHLRELLYHLVPEGLDYARACRETIMLFQSVFPKSSPRVMILKEPVYSMETRALQRIFPEIKFIFIHRDPRGQVNSVRRMLFGSRLISANAYYWNRTQRHLVKQMQKDPQRYCRIAYEDMVRDAGTTVRKLCGFLNIAFSENMLKYYEKKTAIEEKYGLNDPDILNVGLSSFLPPDVALIDSWKNELSPREVKIIEAGCRKYMTALGYIPMYKSNLLQSLRYVPVILHAALQRCIGQIIRMLPFRWRLKIMFSPSLFEATYGRLFGRTSARK